VIYGRKRGLNKITVLLLFTVFETKDSSVARSVKLRLVLGWVTTTEDRRSTLIWHPSSEYFAFPSNCGCQDIDWSLSFETEFLGGYWVRSYCPWKLELPRDGVCMGALNHDASNLKLWSLDSLDPCECLLWLLALSWATGSWDFVFVNLCIWRSYTTSLT